MRTAMRPRYYCDHCNKGNGSPSATALSASESRVQALQREVEELRARMPNALRYEWLRSRYLRVFVADCHGSPVIDIECDDIEPVSESDGRRLDAEIDAASKAEVPNV